MKGPNFIKALKEDGFTLVEIMIAVGMLGGLALAFLQLMKHQNQSMNTTEIRAELIEVSTVIRQTLENKETCEATFIGMAPGDYLSEIRISSDFSRDPFLRVGFPFKNYNVKIEEIRFLTREEEKSDSYALVPPTTTSAINDQGIGYAHIEVTFSKGDGRKQIYGGKDSKKIFPIRGVFADYKILASCDKDELPDLCKDEGDSLNAKYTGDYIRDSSGVIEPIDVQGCSPKGYMYECKIFKDTFPITSCE